MSSSEPKKGLSASAKPFVMNVAAKAFVPPNMGKQMNVEAAEYTPGGVAALSSQQQQQPQMMYQQQQPMFYMQGVQDYNAPYYGGYHPSHYGYNEGYRQDSKNHRARSGSKGAASANSSGTAGDHSGDKISGEDGAADEVQKLSKETEGLAVSNSNAAEAPAPSVATASATAPAAAAATAAAAAISTAPTTAMVDDAAASIPKEEEMGPESTAGSGPAEQMSWRQVARTTSNPTDAPVQRGQYVGLDAVPLQRSLSSPSGDNSANWRRKEIELLETSESTTGVVRFCKKDLLEQFPYAKGAECPTRLSSGLDKCSLGQFSRSQRMPVNSMPQLIITGGAFGYLQSKYTVKGKPQGVSDTESDEYVMSQVNLLLNKLTWENFDKLFAAFLALPVLHMPATEGGAQVPSGGRVLIPEVVSAIVGKAQMEPPFCDMYATFCRRLYEQWLKEDETANEKNPGVIFKKTLLNRLRDDFQMDRVAAFRKIEENPDMDEEEKAENILVLKSAYLGHMQFIGEIFLQKIAGLNTMYTCVDTLLESLDEEKLMCLGRLLRTIGQALDDDQKSHDKVDAVFTRIDEMASDKSLSSRVRFMFLDLRDLRARHWNVGGKPGKGDKAKKILARSQSGSGSSGIPGGDARKISPRSPNGWETVSSKKGGGKGVSAGWNTAGSSSGSPRAVGAKGVKADQKPNAQRGVFSFPETLDPASPAQVAPAPEEQPVRELGSGSAAPTALYGEDGSLDKNALRRARAVLDEFFSISDVTEAMECLTELIHPNAFGEVLKDFMTYVLEKKDKERAALLTLVPNFLQGSPPLLSSEAAAQGIKNLLDDLEDILIDAPLAGLHSATTLGCLVVHGALELSVLQGHSFTSSFRAGEFVVQCLAGVMSAAEALVPDSGLERVDQALKASGLDMLEIGLDNGPRESRDERWLVLGEKYSISGALLMRNPWNR
jgi:translation initiation factor 4G